MMIKLFVFVASIFSSAAYAQMAPFVYRIGSVQVTEAEDSLTLHAATQLKAQVLPGGRVWPRLGVDEDGRIYVGNAVINSADGAILKAPTTKENDAVQALPSNVEVSVKDDQFRIVQGNMTCTFSRQQLGLRPWKSAHDAFRDENIKFASGKKQLLALVAQLEEDNHDDTYVIDDIDLERCRISPIRIGNPDLLIEINRSRDGGWWLTGSIEPTLLRSAEGKRWSRVALPKGISSLISSYVVNNREIWLAGVLPSAEADDPLIVHTSDGGRHWQNVKRGDPLLARLPIAWLEGKRRVAMPVAP